MVQSPSEMFRRPRVLSSHVIFHYLFSNTERERAIKKQKEANWLTKEKDVRKKKKISDDFSKFHKQGRSAQEKKNKFN